MSIGAAEQTYSKFIMDVINILNIALAWIMDLGRWYSRRENHTNFAANKSIRPQQLIIRSS